MSLQFKAETEYYQDIKSLSILYLAQAELSTVTGPGNKI